MGDGTKENASRWLEVAIKATWPILLGMAGWGFNTLWDHESRINTIESTRFTRADANAQIEPVKQLMQDVRVEMATTRSEVSSLKAGMNKIDDKLERALGKR